MQNRTKNVIEILLDSPQRAFRAANRLLTTRLLLLTVALGAALLLCFTAGIYRAIEPSDSPQHLASLTILLIILTALSCCFPASGPRYGEQVPLTPLAAIVSLLTLPPYLAIIPLIVAGAGLVVAEQEPARRLATLDRFILMLASQLGTGLIMHMVSYDANAARTDPTKQFFQIGGVAAFIYGLNYLGGLCLIAVRRRRRRSLFEPRPNQQEQVVLLMNEFAVYVVGTPFALVLALLFTRTSALFAGSVLLTSAAALIMITRSLVEGRLVRRQLHAMDRMTQQAAIGKSPIAERFLSDYLDHCAKLILYDRASAWLYSEEELILEKRLEYTTESVSFQPVGRRLGEELIGRVAERRKPLIVDDARRDARHRYFLISEAQKKAIGPVSIMMLPLLAGGELVGCVEFERRGLSAYSRHDRERIQSLTALVAMSLANNRQHQDVCQQAITDGLTGLFNKRQILKTLADETARAHRYGHTLSVMMLDLDGFKKYNDTFGHMQGDVLLQTLSGLIKQAIRASDIAGRYGGEEFIVVMPETGRDAAWMMAERIRSRVESNVFEATLNYEASIGLEEPTEDRMPKIVGVHKTISIGIATYPADGETFSQVLNRADEALYTAKNTGRNRVVLASYPNSSLPVAITQLG